MINEVRPVTQVVPTPLGIVNLLFPIATALKLSSYSNVVRFNNFIMICSQVVKDTYTTVQYMDTGRLKCLIWKKLPRIFKDF